MGNIVKRNYILINLRGGRIKKIQPIEEDLQLKVILHSLSKTGNE